MTSQAHPGSPLTPILRGGGLLYTARLVAQASRLAYVVLVVRALGADLYGILAYVHAWGILFLPALNMGSQVLLSRAYGQSADTGRQMTHRLWTFRGLLLPLLLCLFLAVTIGSEPDAAIQHLFYLAALALAGRGFASWCNHVLVANRRARHVVMLEVLFRPGELLVAALALNAGVSLTGLLLIHAVNWWLQALLSLWWVSRTVVRPAWNWQQMDASALLRQSFPIMLCALALVGLLQGPLTAGRHILGSSELLGQFALAMQLLQVMVALPNSIGTVALPYLASRGQHATGHHYMRRLVPASMAVVLLLAALSHLAAEPLIELIFGPDLAAAADLLTLGLLALLLPLTPAALLCQSALAAGHKHALRNAALAAVGGIAAAMGMTTILCIINPAPGSLIFGAGFGALCWLLALLGLHRRLAGGQH